MTSFLKLEGTLTDEDGNEVEITALKCQFGPTIAGSDGKVEKVVFEFYPDSNERVYTLKKVTDEEAPEVHS